MLVACRLAGLSALEAYYGGVSACAQFGSTRRSSGTAGKGIGGSGTRAGALQNGFRSVLAAHPPADRNLAPSAVLEPLSLGLLKREATSTSDALPHAVTRQGREAEPLSFSPRSDAQFGPSPIPSLGDGVMLGTAWIDRPVDTRGCTPASTSLPCSMEVQPCPCHLRPVIRLRH